MCLTDGVTHRLPEPLSELRAVLRTLKSYEGN